MGGSWGDRDRNRTRDREAQVTSVGTTHIRGYSTATHTPTPFGQNGSTTGALRGQPRTGLERLLPTDRDTIHLHRQICSRLVAGNAIRMECLHLNLNISLNVPHPIHFARHFRYGLRACPQATWNRGRRRLRILVYLRWSCVH